MSDVLTFVESLLNAFANLPGAKDVALHTEGPIVRGRVFLPKDVFLAFYYNHATGTQAFALIRGAERIWGIDYDSLRGWHLHPADAPVQHVSVEPQSVPAIVEQLNQVLAKL